MKHLGYSYSTEPTGRPQASRAAGSESGRCRPARPRRPSRNCRRESRSCHTRPALWPLAPFVGLSRRLHGSVHFPVLRQPGHVAPLGVLLDLAKELNRLRLVARSLGSSTGMTISTSTAITYFSV